MKKLFTLATLLFATVAVSNAETKTFDVYDVDNEVWEQSFQTNFTDNGDGTYTIADFLNSGCPLTFKADGDLTEGNKTNISFEGTNIDASYVTDYGVVYLLDSTGSDAVLNIHSTDGSTIAIYSPYLYVAGWSYLTPTVTDTEIKVEATIELSGDLEDGNYANYYDVIFDFTIPRDAAIEGIEADNANAPVEFFNLQGVRIDNPSNGIFIRRQGSKVSKVTIK